MTRSAESSGPHRPNRETGWSSFIRRLAACGWLLLKLSQPEGDVRVIRDALTQQDIADRVGASREMVSRILKDLREGGYIEIHERQITLREQLPHGW